MDVFNRYLWACVAFLLGSGLLFASSACALPTAKPKSGFALLVNIGEYPGGNGWNKLPGSVLDANAMKTFLTKDLGWDANNIKSLPDRQATKAAIKEAFKSHLIENAMKPENKDKLFLFYYSGHGSQFSDFGYDSQQKSSEEESDTFDETLVTVDSSENNRQDIVDDEIAEWSKDLCQHADNVLFVIDACHSGSSGRAPGDKWIAKRVPEYRGTRQAEGANSLVPSSVLKNKIQINACRDDETAVMIKQSVMTQCLLEVLRAAPEGATYGDIERDLLTKVQAINRDQHPMIEGDRDRYLFGNAKDRARPHFAINKLIESQKLAELNGGRLFGFQIGDDIQINLPPVNGAKKKPVVAKLVAVSDYTALFPCPPGINAAQLKASRVEALNPNFVQSSTVLNASVGSPAYAAINQIFGSGSNKMFSLRPISASGAKPEADFTVMYGTLRQFKQYGGTLSNTTMPDGTRGYFVLSKSSRPLFDAFLSGRSPELTARSLYDNVFKYCRQTNLRALKGGIGSEDLKKKVVVQLVSADTDAPLKPDTAGVTRVPLGTSFKFKMTNKSPEKLFVTLLCAHPDGSVSILHDPRNASGALSTQDYEVSSEPMYAEGPAGAYYVKAIITNQYIPLTFYVQDPAETRNRTRRAPKQTDYLTSLLSKGIGYANGRRSDTPATSVDAFATEAFEIQLVNKVSRSIP